MFTLPIELYLNVLELSVPVLRKRDSRLNLRELPQASEGKRGYEEVAGRLRYGPINLGQCRSFVQPLNRAAWTAKALMKVLSARIAAARCASVKQSRERPRFLNYAPTTANNAG